MYSLPLLAESLPSVNFDDQRVGLYTKDKIQQHWPALQWQKMNGAQLIDSQDELHKHVLQVNYPKGAVGPSEGGAQFNVTLPPSEELWLSYQVKFSTEFDFKLGGKLPGLTSGGSEFTGGNLPTEGQGWSARYMWHKKGEAIIYLYYMDMPGKWGHNLKLPDFTFQHGVWHTLVQRIKVNRLGHADGILEVWVDGKKKLSRHDIRFRGQEEALIDSFYFSTFHGGNTKKWGPVRDSYAWFDNFIVSRAPLIEN